MGGAWRRGTGWRLWRVRTSWLVEGGRHRGLLNWKKKTLDSGNERLQLEDEGFNQTLEKVRILKWGSAQLFGINIIHTNHYRKKKREEVSLKSL